MAGLAMGIRGMDQGRRTPVLRLVLSLAFSWLRKSWLEIRTGIKTLRMFAAGGRFARGDGSKFPACFSPRQWRTGSLSLARPINWCKGKGYLQTAGAFWNEGLVNGKRHCSPHHLPGDSLGVCLGIPAERRRRPVVVTSSIALLVMLVS